MEDRQLVKELAESLSASLVLALRQSVDPVAFAELRNDFKHAQASIEELRKTVYDEHNPVSLWTKDFIDSYRKVLGTIIASGILAVAAIIIQFYTMLRK